MALLENIDNATLRSEFLRAVNLVTTTQLSMFLDREPPSRDTMIEMLNKKLEARAEPSADPEVGSALPVAEALGEVATGTVGSTTATAPAKPNDEALLQQQAVAMREVLSESLSIYNDPFATYISPQQLKSYHNKRKGNLLGVGIKFRAFDDNYPVIIGALQGAPLEGKVNPGDRMVSIAGIDQNGASSGDVAKLLKGEAGSTVDMLLRADSGDEKSVTATRTQIKLLYARAELMDSRIGYIKVSRFGGSTHETVRSMLQNLLAQGAQSLILDLRDNPGGSTRAARGIVSLFVDKQNVYCERYEAGGMRELPHEGEKLTDIPLAVVVNEHSQSSSEIVAGALQDYGRAKIIGVPTYGKGLIQKVFNLQAPLGGAVRTTIAAYATPSHTLIHGVGVTPDIYEATADEAMFRETGSLNVSEAARIYKRKLLEERIAKDFPEKRAAYLIGLDDKQLLRAIAEVS